MARVTDYRARQVQQAIKDYAASAGRGIEKAFEALGCSCSTLRPELERLNRLCDQAEADMRASPLFTEAFNLREEISRIDRKEHPALDAAARAAIPFFKVWLFDRMSQAEANPSSLAYEDVAAEFAQAWLDGWRPIATIQE
jgi:hypothetical protein